MTKDDKAKAVIRTVSALSEIDSNLWNSCANPEGAAYNPFLSHAFLNALEETGCVCAETGWYPMHLVLEDARGKALGVMPLYLKSHSRGEYVFDQGWAEALMRAGGRYYPKLQCSVPFTPVTGPRFLVPAGDDAMRHRAMLAQGALVVCDKTGASSVHVTFLPEEDWAALADKDWHQRTDTQFHWHNDAYGDFDAFLQQLSSRKRKNIRKERKVVRDSDIEISWLTGSDLKEEHWDAFFSFYLDTGARKWGSPYLNRKFFSRIGEVMADDILLIMARRAGRYIAGALNFIGGDALYGRNWGALEDHPCLHFEACYYQAIEFAISHKLKRVEAGAQGPHKLARGYLPVTTYSLHYLAEPALADAVGSYLQRERRYVVEDNRVLTTHSPFRATLDGKPGS